MNRSKRRTKVSVAPDRSPGPDIVGAGATSLTPCMPGVGWCYRARRSRTQSGSPAALRPGEKKLRIPVLGKGEPATVV